MEAPPSTSSLSAEERHRIERVARFVVRNRDGDVAEAVLQRLLKIARNACRWGFLAPGHPYYLRHARRWGFLAPDHPLHPYYLQQKVSEQCRTLRPRRAGDR